MTWAVQQTRRFARQYKKLHDNTAGDVDAAVDVLTKNPEVGERKKGDLAALRVFKFRRAQDSCFCSATHWTKVFAWCIWRRSAPMKTSIAT
jgi:ParE-like toxin of type II bacterial toxin-antitoxin system